MKIESHHKNLIESFEVIDECIRKGLARRQRTIGFSTSAAAVDMLEILLHEQDLIDPGFVIKHEWFKSKNKVKDKFDFDFPRKEEILQLMFNIEERRNALCYGKPQDIEVIKNVLKDFNMLRKLFKEVGINEV